MGPSVHPRTGGRLERLWDFYPKGEQIHAYFQSYANEFDLLKHIKFGSEVVGVSRDDATKLWRVTFRSKSSTDGHTESLTFERLVIATGSFSKPSVPEIKGIEGFQGEILHSQAFKDPAKYKDKSILVVGLGNTSADSISSLLDVGVKRLIVSHRQKILILPRITKENKILEFTLTFRLLLLIYWLQEVNASLMAKIFLNELKKIERDNFPGLQSHRAFADDRKLPGPKHLMPVVSDDLADNFLNGSLESAPAIQEISDTKSIKFVDGTEARDIDVILFCTGLQSDLASFIPSAFDPYNTSLAPEVFGKLPSRYTDARRVARLYQGVLSLQCPHQLAFLGACLAKRPAFQLYDLITMALAQLWGGNYPMPSNAEMERDANASIFRLAKLIKDGDVKLTGVMGHIGFDQWLNEVAGTGLYEHLGNWTSSKCWKLWWSDRKLYNTLMSGILSTHVLRLFETQRGRKAWRGARKAIMEANENAARFEKSENLRPKKGMV
ncbi:hypothetical protein DL767_009319 [Monosporascus sp. MG133]|nr:hypothetical protein DL767_009319 [Monosporascus sp. MG133]